MSRSFLYSLLFWFMLNAEADACTCPPTSLSLEECAKYEIIFRGKIISVKNCENKYGEAVFEVEDLYKGNVKKNFTVLFECKVPCAQEFRPGDEWIIYTNYRQVTNAMMDWCSRSRKYFAIANQDFYALSYGNTYEAEAVFLVKNLGVHRPLSKDKQAAENRNIRPSMTQSVIILLCSLTAMIMFYWLIRKYFHRL